MKCYKILFHFSYLEHILVVKIAYFMVTNLISFFKTLNLKLKHIKMKKLILSLVVSTTLFACQTKTENTANAIYPANAVGYNIDSSENTAIVVNTVKAMESMDTAAYRSFYAPDAIFHDNLDSMNLDQNVSLISSFKSKGVTVKIEDIYPIWEDVQNKPSEKGIKNYVISYQTALFTKGDKKVRVVMNTVDAMKDGKITEEWITYDTRGIYELLK